MYLRKKCSISIVTSTLNHLLKNIRALKTTSQNVLELALKAVSSLALKYFVSHSELSVGTHGGVILRCCNPSQSNDWNHLWCLISSIPFLKFPSRLDGLT